MHIHHLVAADFDRSKTTPNMSKGMQYILRLQILTLDVQGQKKPFRSFSLTSHMLQGMLLQPEQRPLY